MKLFRGFGKRWMASQPKVQAIPEHQNPTQSSSISAAAKKNRRTLLKWSVAAVGGTVAGVAAVRDEPFVSRAAHADSSFPPVHGQDGNGSGLNPSGTYGVWGDSDSSEGVVGTSNQSSGVSGSSTGDTMAGVLGNSKTGWGVQGFGSIGVYGIGTTTGIRGEGPEGVLGIGDNGVHGKSSSATGSGILAENTGAGFGVTATSNSGHGLYGQNGAGSGLKPTYGAGVWGDSANGFGVYGSSNAAEGVKGESFAWDGVFGKGKNGIHGKSSSPTDSGVWGENAGGGYGVSGSTSGDGTAGVWGSNAAAGYGVKGTSDSGIGVYGFTNRNLGIDTNDTAGVLGENNVGPGVKGDGPVGVWAQTTDGVSLWGRVLGKGDIIVGESPHVDPSGVGTSPPQYDKVFRVDKNGTVFANGGYQTSGADVAEYIPVSDAPLPGDVVEIDPDHPGLFRLSSTPNSTAVAGVISTYPGMTMGAREKNSPESPYEPQLALVGRVPVKASTENGAIRVGDLLIASSIPGHAMLASIPPLPGTVIGKSLGNLDSDVGIIELLVMLR